MTAGDSPRREAWTLLAWVLLALEVAALLYLGARPSGRGPLLVYYAGPPALGAAALLLAGLGFVQAARRRPFARPGRLPAFVVLAVVIGSASYPLPFPARREGRPSRVELRLPVRGEWSVAWGGPDTSRNLLARSRADRRFGYDLVLERDGRLHEGGGERLEQWYAFGAEVLAPCPGTVVRAVGDLPDRPPRDPAAAQGEPGNHLVLEIAPGEFLVLASLRQGSLEVGVGARVEAGAPLAQVGCSSASRFTPGPHLALHVQDSDEPGWAQGVPFWFADLIVEGLPRERAMPRGRPLAGPREGAGERVRRADG